MFKLFFDKNGEQRKGFILADFFLTLVFAVWGIILSKSSYNLSLAANANRDQIDTLSAVVKEMRVQNMLLAEQVDKLSQIVLMIKNDSLTQSQQLKYQKTLVNSSVNPKLILGYTNSDNKICILSISNEGGDLYNLKFICPDGIKESAGVLDDKKSILNGEYFEITFNKLSKPKHIIQLLYEDKSGNKFRQALFLTKVNNEYLASFQESRNN